MMRGSHRSTRDVSEDHLQLRKEHRTQEDIERTYADELDRYTLNGSWKCTNMQMEGE